MFSDNSDIKKTHYGLIAILFFNLSIAGLSFLSYKVGAVNTLIVFYVFMLLFFLYLSYSIVFYLYKYLFAVYYTVFLVGYSHFLLLTFSVYLIATCLVYPLSVSLIICLFSIYLFIYICYAKKIFCRELKALDGMNKNISPLNLETCFYNPHRVPGALEWGERDMLFIEKLHLNKTFNKSAFALYFFGRFILGFSNNIIDFVLLMMLTFFLGMLFTLLLSADVCRYLWVLKWERAHERKIYVEGIRRTS